MALDVPTTGTLIALAGCASQAAWCLLDKLAYLGDERRLVLDVRDVRAVARRERDVQQAPRGAVGAGGRRSGHVRGVHHNGVASFGVVDADARARELAVEAALHAESLAIIDRPLVRAVAAAHRALGSGSVERRRRQGGRGERHSSGEAPYTVSINKYNGHPNG